MEVLSYHAHKREEVVKFLPSNYNKVLEIGCGTGEFRQNLNKECEYWGIESNVDAAEKAKNNLNKVLIGDYFSVYRTLPDSYFDLIICNDIIEHMHDHNLFFKTIKNKMMIHSYLIGSIPNVRYYSNLFRLLILKDWKYQDSGILDSTHLRFFTKRSLFRIFLERDFIIDDFKGINGTKFSLFSMKLILKNLLILLFGPDSRYCQFGFRLINNSKTSGSI